MGMRLKPAKWRSFCIRSGVPSRINFTIGETEIPNLFHKEQKFLGKHLLPTGKLSDEFDYIKSEFEIKPVNHKMWYPKKIVLVLNCKLFYCLIWSCVRQI